MSMHQYWALEELLLAGAKPNQEDLDWLWELGITDVINLTEKPYSNPRLNVHWLPVGDWMPPELEQIETLCALIEQIDADGGIAYLHCQAGCGRTGTMVACLLVARAQMTADEAIFDVRSKRACSIETDAQEEAVFAWASHLEELQTD